VIGPYLAGRRAAGYREYRSDKALRPLLGARPAPDADQWRGDGDRLRRRAAARAAQDARAPVAADRGHRDAVSRQPTARGRAGATAPFEPSARFIADELPAHGIMAGENRVARLCRQRRIWSLHARKRGLSRKPNPPVHDELFDRRFTADRPDEKWLTDITEHPTEEGKRYLCAIRDGYSGPVVGYSMDLRMKAALTVSSLRDAIAL
jgi:transposase InsO family protein